jgi:hypothetical protein
MKKKNMYLNKYANYTLTQCKTLSEFKIPPFVLFQLPLQFSSIYFHSYILTNTKL